jgi:putative transposase
VTTERNKRQRPAPDFVKREFVIKYMNQFWVVGWALGVQMTADLVIMALHTRTPGSVIQHSDQGSLWRPCREMEIRLSMGTVEHGHDNAIAESFFASLEGLIARCS